eukprot:13466069-Alexandrium_andersonii.AAC.1
MSASLVGSEMCIRDRVLTAAKWLERTLARAAPITAEPAEARALASSAGPVSYTHLTLPTICSV